MSVKLGRLFTRKTSEDPDIRKDWGQEPASEESLFKLVASVLHKPFSQSINQKTLNMSTALQ